MTDSQLAIDSIKTLSLEEQIKDALAKDGGPLGDTTSKALIDQNTNASAELIVKAETGIVSGLNIAELVFKTQDPGIIIIPLLHNGNKVKKGDLLMKIHGNARNILTAERIALEFIRRMSGIASRTAEFVREAQGTKCRILDTRKIMPGFGELDKQAVKDGGGTNHRANLSEMGLIKNNHIDVLDGNIAKAIRLFRTSYPDIPLEIEVRNEIEFLSALVNLPDRILLDNMSNDEMTKMVFLRNEFAANSGFYTPLEASGNMSLERINGVAATGVDYISVGELTHSVKALDISLHINFEKNI